MNIYYKKEKKIVKKIHKTLWKPLNFNLKDVPKEIHNFLLSTWKNSQKLLQNKLGPCCFCLRIFWSTPTANSSWCLLMRHFPCRNYSYIYGIFLLWCLLWWLCKWVLPAGAHSEAKTSRPEILFRSSITKLLPDTGGSAETTEVKKTSVTRRHLWARQEVVRRLRRIIRAHIHRHTDTHTHTPPLSTSTHYFNAVFAFGIFCCQEINLKEKKNLTSFFVKWKIRSLSSCRFNWDFFFSISLIFTLDRSLFKSLRNKYNKSSIPSSLYFICWLGNIFQKILKVSVTKKNCRPFLFLFF